VGFPTPVPDPRNTAYYIAKDSGTSMASPQVAGILACALEQTPTLNQAGALSLITTAAKLNQIPNSGGSYDDLFSLQGAPNRYLTLPDSLKS
jgi:subtilisin family serine protease